FGFAEEKELPGRHLRMMLASEPDVTIVGEAADGIETLKLIAALRPDVVLLDVEMPGLDGFGVVQNLTAPAPLVVFITAHEHYAVRAFDANATDYLLKPVQPGRL